MHDNHVRGVQAAFVATANALEGVRQARRAYVREAVQNLINLEEDAKRAARGAADGSATVGAPLAATGFLCKEPAKAYTFGVCCAFALAVLMSGHMLSVADGVKAIIDIGLSTRALLGDDKQVADLLTTGFRLYHGTFWVTPNYGADSLSGQTLWASGFWSIAMKQYQYLQALVAKPTDGNLSSAIFYTAWSFYMGDDDEMEIGSEVKLAPLLARLIDEYPRFAGTSLKDLDTRLRGMMKKGRNGLTRAEQNGLKFYWQDNVSIIVLRPTKTGEKEEEVTYTIPREFEDRAISLERLLPCDYGGRPPGAG